MQASAFDSGIPPVDTNVARRLDDTAADRPNQVAIAVPTGRARLGLDRPYRNCSFSELATRTTVLADGFRQLGMGPGQRIVLAVPFGDEFITLVFALLKAGVSLVLVDPGMGRRNLIACLEAAQPDGFVAVPKAQLIRRALSHRFPKARYNVTCWSGKPLWPSTSLASLERLGSAAASLPVREPDDPAAIIFTTGSTGPPKGVLYTHATFNHQIDLLRAGYGIEPGGIDLSGFPLFGLFNAVMGTTTVIPDMDPTRPADVDPPRLLDAIDRWQVNQAFGSPALWTTVGAYCQRHGRRMQSLTRVLSAGAAVPPRVLEQLRAALPPEAQVFTPYGATEALPVASIESRQVLEETAAATQQGAGTCVGSPFPGIAWQVIAIDDGPLNDIGDCQVIGHGEIGELMVAGPVVTRQYVTREDQNPLHKVRQGDRIWHRMGDVGYLDSLNRFWYCGRKSQRVKAASGTLFTEPCEAVINTHPAVYRAALVGPSDVGLGRVRPMLVVEPWADRRPRGEGAKRQLEQELLQLVQAHRVTRTVERVLVYPKRLPTDIRHNAKIFREQLQVWAADQR
jgi:acyl-CoA synthetase (AMP-forming)/AMP-acid ligase II